MKNRALVVALKEALDKAGPAKPPGNDVTETFGRKFDVVLDALKHAGYELQCAQGGISGTYVYVVETGAPL